MSLLVVDMETFYEDKAPVEGEKPYSIKNLSIAEYVKHPKFKLLGFGLANEKAAAYTHGDTLLRTPAFRARLEDSTIICHNAHFDIPILAWLYGIRPKGIICTLSMARAMGHRMQVGGSLEKLCLHYGIGQKPPLRPDSSPEEVELRGHWDAWATWKLFKILAVDFPRSEYPLIDLTIRQFIDSPILVDVPKAMEASATIKAARAAALAKVGATEKDLGSTPKLVEIFESLGVDVPMKPSPNVPDKWIPAFAKTDDGMQELLNHEDETVQAIAEARIAVKGVGDDSRADTFVRLAAYGPLPIFYKYWGTHPGRWSGGDGTNLANLRRGGVLRDCLIAPPGHVLIEADMKQIQARLALWLAGQADLLEAFAQGRDVYCEVATRLFQRADRPVTREKIDEPFRFCGKFWSLGGNFGMGGKKGAKQMRAEINKRGLVIAPPTEEEAIDQVNEYRALIPKVVELWDRFEWFAAEPGRTLGPLTMGQNKMILPNGTAVHYANLRQEHYKGFDGRQQYGWRYNGMEGRVSIWGGKFTQNCIGEGTEVLTDVGWLPIEKVTVAHRVWDGLEWVNHSGIAFNGIRETIEVAGVRMTPDHRVLTTQGWRDGIQAHGFDRAEVRHPHSVGACADANERRASPVARTLSVRCRALCAHIRRQVDEGLSAMRGIPRQPYSRHVETSRFPCMGFDATALQQPQACGLAQLWGARNQGLPSLGTVREFLGRHGRSLFARHGSGPNQQRQGVQPVELSVGVSESQFPQQTQHEVYRHALGAYDDPRGCGAFGATRRMYPPTGSQRSPSAILVRSIRRSQQVYDILNCGPRQRFVVRGSGSPLIVHNCALALERALLAHFMLKLKPYWQIVMHTYDSLCLCVKESQVDSAKSAMTEVMTKQLPAWAAGLPVGIDIGVGRSYGECGDK